jgi:hypothetical protein
MNSYYHFTDAKISQTWMQCYLFGTRVIEIRKQMQHYNIYIIN